MTFGIMSETSRGGYRLSNLNEYIRIFGLLPYFFNQQSTISNLQSQILFPGLYREAIIAYPWDLHQQRPLLARFDV